MKQSNWQNVFYHRYVKHLPEIPFDAPPEHGRTYHVVELHQKRCGFLRRWNPDECDCEPTLRRHVEPKRS
jgi:hypothetical protein